MLGHALTVALLLQSSPGGKAAPVPAAIVSALQGNAWVQSKARGKRRAMLYDWLELDAVVDVAADARLELIMIDGHRYALAGGASARVSATSVTKLKGIVTTESSIPALVSLAPIAGGAPKTSGAVRVRGQTVTQLNPCEGVRTLRDETVLSFDPVEGAARYVIDVRNRDDEQVFTRSIDGPPLAIPAGVLAAGTEYTWTVRADGPIPPAKSENRFATLDAGAEAARRALVSTLDPAANGLLGGIDLHLGLLNESIAELTLAAQRAPDDTEAHAAVKRAHAALAAVCK
jgi:hypothetical protein